MIWRLTYCNKNGVEARVDIIKGDRTSVEIVKGSANPFTTSYRLDKNDRSGHIMTSSADIEFFETEEFNIDKLKTSNETELKVEYFEGNVLTWSGFILPDFFSREIGSPNIVRMTASDRLSALKGVTLNDLPIRVSLRDLIELCLEQTGLDLALVAQIQINQGSTNILDAEILSQRLTDVRGRSISCYDILMSIMVGTNSTIRQREGQWVVYNKLEHELRTPTVFFDKVEKGAIRTIQPVASSVGVYNEFGGGRSYPENYDFSDGLTGWTAVNGFVAAIDNRKVDNFVSGTGVIPQEWTTNPVYGDATEKNYLVNDNYGIDYDFADKPYLKSSDIPVTYPSESQINVNVLVNATGPFIDSTEYRGETNFAVIASNGTKTLHLTASGVFEPLTGDPFLHKVTFDGDTHLQAVSSSKTVNGVLSVEEGNLSGYNITVRLYGYTKGVTGGRFLVTTLVNSVIVTFKNLSDAPKGNLYKTTQGSNFTKQHDIETTIFGDYITTGLNGYFYDYPIDDTSNLYLPSGELTSPTWATIFDTTGRPLLHHISRQKSRLFSIAHDILKANINVESFDPLAVFQDCKGGKYVVVSASFDFLRSEVNVELEQIAYDNTILKRDFIYSYFGEGESNIKSIGGISGGGGGTGGGGGMTSEQLEMLTNLASWWKLDEENDAIYSEKSVYSLKGVSALGLGDGGGSGGGADMLDDWANYAPAKADYYVPASLLVPFRDDTLSRLASLEAGGGVDMLEIGGRNYFSINDFVADNKARGYSTIEVIQHEGNIAYRSSSITNNHLIPRYLQGKFEANTQYYLQFKINWESYTDPGAQYIFQIRYTDGTTSNLVATTSHTSRSMLTASGKTIDYITTTRQYDGTVVIYNVQIEKANKPSDWRPAPEDQISDWNTTDVTSFSYIKNKPTQLSQFTDNIGIGAHIANKANPHAVTTAQIGAVDLTTAQTITGAKTFNANITLGINRYIQGTDNYTGVWNVDNLLWRFGSSRTGSVTNIRSEKVGVGTDTPLYKLDVSGDGRFTNSLITPKVDFGNGFTIEPSGTELVFKYNGVIKQRMLSTGTILATGGITALST